MNLYVWDNVLYDYTCGVVFTYADSVEEAREKIKEYKWNTLRCKRWTREEFEGNWLRRDFRLAKDIQKEPYIFKEDDVFILLGEIFKT